MDPRNLFYSKSNMRVTPAHQADHDARILKLENEQKLLSTRLSKDIYKNVGDLNRARAAQNRSFERVIDHRNEWDRSTSRIPRVNEERDRESERFIGAAQQIQNQYDNIINEHAKKKGMCGYLQEEDCTGENCYWFGKEDVAGKDIGCYSNKEERKNWSVRRPVKRSKATKLGTIQENPVAAMQHALEQKRNEENKEPNFSGHRPSSSYPDRGARGGKKKTKRRKRKRRKRKKTRKHKKKRRRRTKRRRR